MAGTVYPGGRKPLPADLVGALEQRFGDRFERSQAVLGQHGAS